MAVEKPDTTLRPGMTTGNAIETYTIKNVLHIPLEAVASDSGVTYVYKRSGTGIVRQQVLTGAMNDDEVVVTRGLSENDRVLLSPPANKDKAGAGAALRHRRADRGRGFDQGPPAGAGHPGAGHPGLRHAGSGAGIVASGKGTEAVSVLAQVVAHGKFALRTALEAVGHNKIRAALTSLGILFGVASVIAMLAIGKGAEQEILAQMRLLGIEQHRDHADRGAEGGRGQDGAGGHAAEVHAGPALRRRAGDRRDHSPRGCVEHRDRAQHAHHARRPPPVGEAGGRRHELLPPHEPRLRRGRGIHGRSGAQRPPGGHHRRWREGALLHHARIRSGRPSRSARTG